MLGMDLGPAWPDEEVRPLELDANSACGNRMWLGRTWQRHRLVTPLPACGMSEHRRAALVSNQCIALMWKERQTHGARGLRQLRCGAHSKQGLCTHICEGVWGLSERRRAARIQPDSVLTALSDAGGQRRH
jgi:hypothetical protein